MYTITTLDRLKARLGLTTAADDMRLLAALQAASAQIERGTGRRFCPTVAAIPHDIEPSTPGELILADDLLELTALADASGDLDTANVLLLPGGESASILRRFDYTAFQWDVSREQAVTVTGVWGWHDDAAQMWRLSGDTLAGALDDTATAFTAADAGGADIMGESPRFQVGHLLRIEGEYLRVLSVDTATNTVTVLRGVNGTTAASHAAGTVVETYQPPADIAMLVLRWAAWLYREPDNRLSGGVPPVLSRALDTLRRVTV